jgi:hypothetical protein
MTLREALRLPWDLMSVLVQCCREQYTVGLEFGFGSGSTPNDLEARVSRSLGIGAGKMPVLSG